MPTQPPHLDLFALIILLGVTQSLFLGVFFLAGSRGRNVATRCVGWLMLALSVVLGEIFLGYSNYMFQLLALVDFSEPLNFVMAPLFFFFVFTRLRGRLPRRWGWHFLPAALWTINAVSWLVQPVELKYNNYLHAYHPELPYVTEPPAYLPEDFFGLRHHINLLTFLSCLIYNGLCLFLIYRTYQRMGYSFWRNEPGRLAQLRNLCLLFLAIPLLIAVIKPLFYEDLGDYLLASYLTVIVYVTSMLVMAGSPFFADDLATGAPSANPLKPAEMSFVAESIQTGSIQNGRIHAGPTQAGRIQAGPKKKYEKSSLSEEVEAAVLGRLNRVMETDKAYLQSDLSLTRLATQLQTSPHHLSQLLNDRLNQSFFDLLAMYRIREAQQLLLDPTLAHVKIDDIAERVGYNSPSAFHTAFKRITSQTPAQFRAGGLGQRV